MAITLTLKSGPYRVKASELTEPIAVGADGKPIGLMGKTVFALSRCGPALTNCLPMELIKRLTAKP